MAELLSSETLLARSLGIRADWRLIQSSPDFFSVTRKIHHALQGAEINLTDLKKEIYETVTLQDSVNAARESNHRCHKIRAASRGTATPAQHGITRAVESVAGRVAGTRALQA